MKKYIFYRLSKIFLIFILFLWLGPDPDVLGEENKKPSGPSEEESKTPAFQNLTDMVQIISQIQSFNSDNPELWNNAMGEVIAGSRGTSTESQAASAQSTSQDIALAHQQEIDKIRQQRAALEELQGRIQNLINQYNRSGGNVNQGWINSCGGARTDWQNIIKRTLSQPRSPGGTGGGTTCGGGSDQGAPGQGPGPATSEPASGTATGGEPCGSGTEEVDTGPESVSGPPPRPTNLEQED